MSGKVLSTTWRFTGLVSMRPDSGLGNSAAAVAVNAPTGLGPQARAGGVKWPCAITFGLAGLAGSLVGAQKAKQVDGKSLPMWFAVAIIAIANSMLIPKKSEGEPAVRLTLPVVLMAMVPMFAFTNWQWASLALASPVVVWGAWPMHQAAWTNLKHGAATMDTLISLGVGAAFAWSLYALFFGGAGMPGEAMGLVGETGLGKSTGALGVLVETGKKGAPAARDSTNHTAIGTLGAGRVGDCRPGGEPELTHRTEQEAQVGAQHRPWDDR